MECYKCGKQLTLYGPSAICQCRDCEQYFCENEGDILDNKKFVEVAKGNTDRIVYDFLCYGCETYKKVVKEQNKKAAKSLEEREQAEMLQAQRLHSSDNWEAKYEDLERLPEIGNTISDMRRGFQGEFRTCSVYDKLYGSKWPSKDTKIYLIFTHYNQSNNYYEKPIKTTEYYCLPCAKRFVKNWWKDLKHGFFTRNMDRVREKLPDL